jgi:hypothetical protein
MTHAQKERGQGSHNCSCALLLAQRLRKREVLASLGMTEWGYARTAVVQTCRNEFVNCFRQIEL